jgi:hypothetical protein
MRRIVRSVLPVLVALLAVRLATAAPYGVGDRMAPMTLPTPSGEAVVVGPGTRLVLVTHDMDGGAIAKAVLADHTRVTLAARGAVYVADVSGMPGLVTRFVAIPRLRRRPYPVLLDRDGATRTLFPVVAGAVTAVSLDDGRIVRLEQLTSEAALRATLASDAAAP